MATLKQQMHELTQNIRKILQQRFHVSHTITKDTTPWHILTMTIHPIAKRGEVK